MIQTVDVGAEFSHRLTNRDSNQGDGKHTAIEFRQKYLVGLDSPDAWSEPVTPFIKLDFSKVRKIGPSFATEAFAHYTQYANPQDVLKRIVLVNATRVQRLIIERELEAGYATK